MLEHFELVEREFADRVIVWVARHLLDFKDFLCISVLCKPSLVDLVVGQIFLKLILGSSFIKALRSK